VDVVVGMPCYRVCSNEVDDGAGMAKLETPAMKDADGYQVGTDRAASNESTWGWKPTRVGP
jgi:hypothetical protein